MCFVFMLLFLPETLRALVGDGGYVPRPAAIYKPLIPIIGNHRHAHSASEKPPVKPFQNPLRLFTYPDVLVLLFFGGIVYAVFYAVTASISVLFVESYPFLTETDVGLCFLAIGGSAVFGSVFAGKFLDRDYQNIKRQMIELIEAGKGEAGLRVEDVTKEENFPIERARLRMMPIYLGMFTVATIGYGWCLQTKVNIAVPLVLQVFSKCPVFLIFDYMHITLTDTFQQ